MLIIGCCLFTLIWQFNKRWYTILHWPLHEWLGKVLAWMAENPLSVPSSNLFVPFFPWCVYFSKFNAMMHCLFDLCATIKLPLIHSCTVELGSPTYIGCGTTLKWCALKVGSNNDLCDICIGFTPKW
jgi:hypothetical protein